tara:strand:+ start:3354 stop:3659 length:306 start_codon:yes stop_codon:yes gene_type:complete
VKANDIIQQIERMFGRQPQAYMIRLINDALIDISSKKKEYTVSSLTTLEQYKRWYTLDDQVIDIVKVEIKDTDDRYVRIPKLADAHNLLREDTESSDDSLT